MEIKKVIIGKGETPKKSKGIIFSTEMVKAILEGRKTQTRRVITNLYDRNKFFKLVDSLNGKKGLYAGFYKDSDVFTYEGTIHTDAVYSKAKYQVGDILWVRETWCRISDWTEVDPEVGMFDGYIYKADTDNASVFSWRPSIHMPKEAARIFLKVKDVKVERLNDITEKDAVKEGFINTFGFIHSPDNVYDPPPTTARCKFIADFCRIYVKDELDTYNNPWVWIIEFERTEELK